MIVVNENVRYMKHKEVNNFEVKNNHSLFLKREFKKLSQFHRSNLEVEN